jgi:hypothetical protein
LTLSTPVQYRLSNLYQSKRRRRKELKKKKNNEADCPPTDERDLAMKTMARLAKPGKKGKPSRSRPSLCRGKGQMPIPAACRDGIALDNYKKSCEVRVSSRKLTLLKPLPLFFLSWRGCLAYISPPPFQAEMPPKPQCSNPYKRVIPPPRHDRHRLHNYGCPSTH